MAIPEYGSSMCAHYPWMMPASSKQDLPGDASGASASERNRVAQEDSSAELDMSALPAVVRDRLVELAATVLGNVPIADVPRQLRPVARFAPAKRAKRGATALMATLRDSAAFRATVVAWLREHHQDALNPDADDSVAAAAASILLGEVDADDRIGLAARGVEEATLRTERDVANARVRKLESEAERLRGELDDARSEVERARAHRETELNRLRGRLREQGVTLRAAKDEAAEAKAQIEQAGRVREEELASVRAELAKAERRAATEQARAESSLAEADSARRSAKEAREADEVRLRLLLDTLDGALAGLRAELAIREPGSGSSLRPADTAVGAGSGYSSGRVADTDGLDGLLALPAAHLVIDGYNVTKTGYPELVLAEQRARLIRQLAAFVSRVGAEVTVVFDGAGVVSVPAAAPRGVRVLFSDPGVSADDVIRGLVAAEPRGRPVVVATSDRAVAESVRAGGAHHVKSDVLISRLSRV